MAKTRSIEEIDQDYYKKVAELGDREFKMTTQFPKQIENLKRELNTLINEMEIAQKEALREATKKTPVTKAKLAHVPDIVPDPAANMGGGQ